MTHEAKFSVVLPASNLTAAQIDTFEQTVTRYGLPVKLPLRSDLNGNLIVSSSMSLREAQMLRRQIANCGFPADVVSDASQNAQTEENEPVSLDTLVVELKDVPDADDVDPVSEITSDAWSSLEIPSLDLGLSGADVLDDKQDWNGENWLNPDGAGERTLSLSAGDLIKVAQTAAQDAALGMSSAASKTGNKTVALNAPAKSQIAAVPPRKLETKTPSQNPKLHEPVASAQKAGASTSVRNVTLEQLEYLMDPAASDGAKSDNKEDAKTGVSTSVRNVTLEQLEYLKDPSAPDGANKTAEKESSNVPEKPDTPAKNQDVKPSHSDEKSSGSDKKSETDEPQKAEQNVPSVVAEKSSMKALALVALVLVAVCLVLTLISTFVTPLPFLETLVKPLF